MTLSVSRALVASLVMGSFIVPAASSARAAPAAPTLEAGPAASRFLSSAFYLVQPGGRTVGYDIVTRCAVSIAEGGKSATVVSPSSTRAESEILAQRLPVLNLASRASADTISLAQDGGIPDHRCLERIEAAYGSEFEKQSRKFGAIARHAIRVLQGEPVDGPDQTASDLAVRATKRALQHLAGKIEKPVFLGAVTEGNRTIVMIGSPETPYRFLVQYGNLQDGTWQFEGGIDAGVNSY